MHSTILRAAVSVIALLPCQATQPASQPGRERLEVLKKTLPNCDYFNDWLDKTGALPPDYDSLPACPFLPDPLTWRKDGAARPVTASDWPVRRAQIADLVETWLLGHAPPPPGNVRAVITDKTTDRGRDVWHVRLEFGPDHAAALNCTLYLPNGKMKPAPVFLSDSTRYISWAADAMDAGFAYCKHNAGDRDDESEAYADMFGQYDWAAFRRRAWSAARVVDWLGTLDFVDKDKIVVGGHSRSGKSAMAAAAFDPRIAAVIASSPGSGGSIPYRYCDGTYFGESAEKLTGFFSDWVLLKVRFFAGRENKLPADSHFLYSLIAPRPLLMSTALNDWVENTWSIEQVYRTNLSVYKALGRADNVALRYREGQHRVDGETAHAFSRFMLAVAAGQPAPAKLFPYDPIHVWDYDAWAAEHLAAANAGRFAGPPTEPHMRLTAARWPGRRAGIRERIDWLLGDGPAYAPTDVTFGQGESDDLTQLLGHDRPVPPTVKAKFGGGINANLYYPSGVRPTEGQKLPAVLWLGPLSCSGGYNGFYGVAPIAQLTEGGFVVLCHDPIATGGRQIERRDFYKRHPDWSLTGKMVLDARGALDVLEQSPDVDHERIYLVGYAMGGMTGAFVAAEESRLAGAAIVAGVFPMRTDTDEGGTGGIRRWSHLYGWVPRLGAFVGRERDVPVDFDVIIAAAAPTPMLIVQPEVDWHADPADVRRTVDLAGDVYQALEARDSLKLVVVENTINDLSDVLVQPVVDWLKKLDGR
jgi:dienelactone hydrolase